MMRETIRLSAAVEEGERLADVATYLLADELCDGPDGGANVSDELPAPHDGPPPPDPPGARASSRTAAAPRCVGRHVLPHDARTRGDTALLFVSSQRTMPSSRPARTACRRLVTLSLDRIADT